jgi:hypothetical protein
MAYCGILNWEYCQYRAFNMRVEQEKTLRTSPIIRGSEQVEISYTFDKAVVFTVL